MRNGQSRAGGSLAAGRSQRESGVCHRQGQIRRSTSERSRDRRRARHRSRTRPRSAGPCVEGGRRPRHRDLPSTVETTCSEPIAISPVARSRSLRSFSRAPDSTTVLSTPWSESLTLRRTVGRVAHDERVGRRRLCLHLRRFRSKLVLCIRRDRPVLGRRLLLMFSDASSSNSVLPDTHGR